MRGIGYYTIMGGTQELVCFLRERSGLYIVGVYNFDISYNIYSFPLSQLIVSREEPAVEGS